MLKLLAALSTCPACGLRSAGPAGICAACLADLFQAIHEPGLLALGRFEGRLARAVRALKFSGVTRLAGPLAAELAAQVQRRGWQPSALTSVPLHPSRLLERGYNQAALLAQACAAQLGVPWLDLLERRRQTSQQARLATPARSANVSAAFTLSAHAPRVLPLKILIIDDVITSGATLEACRQTLLRAGARQVWAATVAAARPRTAVPVPEPEPAVQPAVATGPVFRGRT